MDQSIVEDRVRNYKRAAIRHLNAIITEAEEARDYLEDNIDTDPADVYNNMLRIQELDARAQAAYNAWIALS